MAAWRLQPPWWAVLGVLAGVSLFCTLGTWQIHRAQAKQALLDRYAASAQVPTQPFAIKAAVAGAITHVKVRGHYEAARQLLLDNQSHQQRPGYQVWTPLRLHSGELMMVNRGWIPLTNRAALPVLSAPPELQQLTGYWQPLPKAGMRLAPVACVKATTYPQLVNYPTAQDLACLLGEPVVGGELLLDADQPAGYARVWNFDSGIPPSRHYGYAVQWFALATTLMVIFFKLNLKRKP